MTLISHDQDRPEDLEDGAAVADFDDVEQELLCSTREAGLSFQLVPGGDR
ncbi:MAG TPA: hypothetical protein VKR22_13660 [Acidimicrobiales bacterium]|nr:hypothetical protein [Acidimicrobiales bacterium]